MEGIGGRDRKIFIGSNSIAQTKNNTLETRLSLWEMCRQIYRFQAFTDSMLYEYPIHQVYIYTQTIVWAFILSPACMVLHMVVITRSVITVYGIENALAYIKFRHLHIKYNYCCFGIGSVTLVRILFVCM